MAINRRVLWICPVVLPTVPPTAVPGNVDFIECRNTGEVEDMMRQADRPVFDVVVVDTSPAEHLGYDPVDAVSLLASQDRRPPRYLVAVVMRGLTAEFADAPLAFAVEMRDLWDRNRPSLIIEEAALYYLEKPANGDGDKDVKRQSISQEPRWGSIAARAVRMASGEIMPSGTAIPVMAHKLVTAVCATRQEESAPFLSKVQRDILFLLARQRSSPRDIATQLTVSENYVRRQQAAIVTTLSPFAAGPVTEAGQSANGAFCNELINRYGSWLVSRSVRSARPAGALPVR
jgi:hypothetical protein